MRSLPPPATEAALIDRADALAGATVGALCDSLGLPCPADLRRHKGFIGDLVEAALGAPGGSASAPDFPALGVELKTIPVRPDGAPRGSTWVCTAPLFALDPGPWRDSAVCTRLARVLFVPVLGDGPPATRRFGVPVLWSPSADQEAVLAADWDTLTDLLVERAVSQWTADHGVALQLRPKAASSRHRVEVLDQDGDLVETVPLGFYLRRSFTAEILATEPRLLRP
jgi:DNA mismatch repair protein MutH